MKPAHIAFILEQAYGHIVPTLGILLQLMRRGHRVSYAVTSSFSPLVRSLGAQVEVFAPKDTRTPICEKALRPDGSHDFSDANLSVAALFAELKSERTADSVRQLQKLYATDRPDLLVHDDFLDGAGRLLAAGWGVPKVLHDPIMLSRSRAARYCADDDVVLVAVPKFFNEDIELFDDRFKYVGFIPEGRRQCSKPWIHDSRRGPVILACPTTGFLPPINFCRLLIRAFENAPWTVVLTLPGDLDPLSRVELASLPSLPGNFIINRHSSNLDILQHAALFVGQGGQGSTLEALYCGVPALLIPPSPGHDYVANRVANLGLGQRLHIAEASPQRLLDSAVALIADVATRARVREAQQLMRADRGAMLAADIVEDQLLAHRSDHPDASLKSESSGEQ